jgi:hypothetical protein
MAHYGIGNAAPTTGRRNQHCLSIKRQKKGAAMKKVALFLLSTMSLVGSLNCGEASDSSNVTPDTPLVDSTKLVTSTSVKVNADGTTSESVTYLTPSQMRAEVDYRNAQLERIRNGIPSGSESETRQSAITLDFGCAAASMWIYDTTDTSGNRLCYTGAGTDHLGFHCHKVNIDCVDNWDTAAKSFWPGSRSGNFVPYTGHGCAQQNFAVWGAFTQFSCPGFENTITQN